MKNNIKFATVAAPFAAVAAITPIGVLTACNKDNPTLTIDLSKAYTPTITQLADKTGGYTTAEMLTKYYADIAVNPLVLAEDIANVMYSSNASTTTGTSKIYISKIDTTNHTVSMKFVADETITDGTTTTKSNGYEEFINVPYTVQYDTDETKLWYLVCGLDATTIKTAKNWEIHVHYTSTTTGKEAEKEDFDATASSTDEVKTKALKYIYPALPSRYIAKCTYNDGK